VPRLLRISLRALEIVDRSAHELPGLLVWTNGVHGVPHHLQRLERDHHLVVLDIIADKHQNFCGWHIVRPSSAESLATKSNDNTGRVRLAVSRRAGGA